MSALPKTEREPEALQALARRVARGLLEGPVVFEQRKTHSGRSARVPAPGAWFPRDDELAGLLAAVPRTPAQPVASAVSDDEPGASLVRLRLAFYRSLWTAPETFAGRGQDAAAVIERLRLEAREHPADAEGALARALSARLWDAAQKARAPSPLLALAARITAALAARPPQFVARPSSGSTGGDAAPERLYPARFDWAPRPGEALAALRSVRRGERAPLDRQQQEEQAQAFLLRVFEASSGWQPWLAALAAPGQPQGERARAQVGLADAVYRDLRNAAFEGHRRRDRLLLPSLANDGDGGSADGLSLLLDGLAARGSQSELLACLREDLLSQALQRLFESWPLGFLLVLEVLVEGEVDVPAWAEALRTLSPEISRTAVEVRLTRARQLALYRFFALYFDFPRALRAGADGADFTEAHVRCWELSFLSSFANKKQAIAAARRELGVGSEQRLRDLRDQVSRWTLLRLEEELGSDFAEVETGFKFLLFGDEAGRP